MCFHLLCAHSITFILMHRIDGGSLTIWCAITVDAFYTQVIVYCVCFQTVAV